MNLNKISNGEKIAGVSAVLLFAFMFLNWFGVESSDDSFGLFSVGHSAWDALDYTPIVLMAAIIAPLAVAAFRLTGAAYRPPVPANAVVAILGSISVLLIFLRVFNPPSFGSFGTSFGTVSAEGTVQFGIFLGLLAAAGIAFGGWRAMKEEGDYSANLRARRH